MSPDPGQQTTEPVPLPGQLVAAAKDWADGKTAKEMAMELYVRWLQIATACVRVSEYFGIDLDGEPLLPGIPLPKPHPDVLRSWLAQLLPPGSHPPTNEGGNR